MPADELALELNGRTPRHDGPAKVTGAERYAVDRYPPGHLWAGAKRAGMPHGRILAVETAEAEAVPGVVAVLTARDVPGPNRHGIIHQDTPVLADRKVRHCGDAVALVVAESPQALQAALQRIRLHLEPLPVVGDPDAALREGAPRVHEDHPTGNVLAHATIEKGDPTRAFAECAVVVEREFSTPVQAHLFLETENGLARLAGDGTLEIVASTQAPFRDRIEVARALGLPFERIRVTAPYLGGGFGGKDGATVQCLLALAALKVPGRWIKMVWSREENLLAGTKRHAARMHYRAGALADGTLHALECRLTYDTGAYAHLGGEVMELGMEHAAGPYRIANARVEGLCVYTNNPVAGAMRAFGVCQVSFAIEQIVELLAERLGLDPLEFRRQNALRSGDENLSSVRLSTSTGIGDCLEKVMGHLLWRERREWQAAAPRQKLRGVGVAAMCNAMGYGRKVRDSAIARVELTEDGNFLVNSGVSDMGQGNASTFAQIAGAILRQDAGRIAVEQPDTSRAYPSGSSSAGRTTYVYGNALTSACHQLGERIRNRAGLLLFVDDDRELQLVPGGVFHPGSGREISLARIGAFMKPEERVAIAHFVAPVAEAPEGAGKGFPLGFPHLIFSYSAHLAAIEIDRLTGAIEVIRYLAVTDGGRVLNPTLFEQQIEGSVAQGIGYALLEDLILKDGAIRTGDLSTYLIPTSLDLPPVETAWVDSCEETGPLGMKGVGEVAMNGPLPAIANAFFQATGQRITRAPLTPERVLRSLEDESERGGRG